jgi:hypothetical protein
VSAAEPDRLDETLVAADAWRGVADLPDKRLRLAFHRLLERGVELVVIIDACHSGSAARGYPQEPTGVRRLDPAPRDSAPAATATVPAPEENPRALVLAAALPHQLAGEVEVFDEPGCGAEGSTTVCHSGLFTRALRDSLLRGGGGENVARLFERLRARMRASERLQEPYLGATVERRQRPLLGGAAAPAATVVAVARVDPVAAEVVLEAGWTLGLSPGVRLSVDAVRVEVAAVNGPSRSLGRVVEGEAGQLTPGSLLKIDEWPAAQLGALRLWWEASPYTERDLLAFAGALRESLGAKRWVCDPTETTPRATVSFREGGWVLVDGRGERRLPPDPRDAGRLARSLTAGPVFLDLPASRELAERLRDGGPDPGLQRAANAASAHYRLVGRSASACTDDTRAMGLEYVWVRPGASTLSVVGLPARTRWTMLPSTPDEQAVALRRSGADAAKLLRWLTVEPTIAEPFPFPYRLAIRPCAAGAAVLAEDAVLMEGERYELVLEATTSNHAAALADSGRRYAYVCLLGADGSGMRLYPRTFGTDRDGCGRAVDASNLGAGDLDQPLPLRGESPALVPLPTPVVLGFTRPFGLETFVLVTTRERLLDVDCDLEGNAKGALDAGESWAVQRIHLPSAERGDRSGATGGSGP